MINSYIRLFLFVAFVAALSYFPINASHDHMCAKIIKHASPKYNYVIVSGQRATNFLNAHKVCERIHGTLADVNSFNTLCLSGALGRASPAWIRSWNGDDYRNACIALYSNGAVAIPPGSCRDHHSFICQVSKSVNVCPLQKCDRDNSKDNDKDYDWESCKRSCSKYREDSYDESENDRRDGKRDNKCDGKHGEKCDGRSRRDRHEGRHGRRYSDEMIIDAKVDRIVDDIMRDRDQEIRDVVFNPNFPYNAANGMDRPNYN